MGATEVGDELGRVLTPVQGKIRAGRETDREGSSGGDQITSSSVTAVSSPAPVVANTATA